MIRVTVKTDLKAFSQSMIQALYDIQSPNIIREAALSVLAVQKTRIHEEGKATDGSTIGTYSKKPIYISAKQNPGRQFAANTGKPNAKTGNVFDTFQSGEKQGQAHTSKYFEGGYEEYKSDIGRNEIGTVNLSLSGQLNAQYTVLAEGNEYGLGWPNDEMLQRAYGLEKKYGKPIWDLSANEEKLAEDIINDLTYQILSHAAA